MHRLSLAIFVLLISAKSFAQKTNIQTDTTKKTVQPEQVSPKKWFETFSIRGYVQARYNRLLENNPNLQNEQADKSWGNNGGFFLRRIRVIFSGQISKQVYFYIQPDFASSVSSESLHFGQLRDAYFDIGLDKKNEFRVRLGQSKIPFGFENLQSSSNRLPLDRADGLNSSISNERDLGAFMYWAPEEKRKLFSELVSKGLKGTGDYGVVGLGLFNGQTANKPDLNNQRHAVARFTYPMRVGNQIIEPGIQGYTGKYVLDKVSTGVKTASNKSYIDERAAASFVLYPQPFGIQAEYNFGRGPEFNKQTDSIEVQNLNGAYITASYQIKYKDHLIFPFVRGHYYDGGKKHELDARSYSVRELEVGIEWQPIKQLEFVAQYTMSRRRYEDFAKQDNLQKGHLLRLQAQINF